MKAVSVGAGGTAQQTRNSVEIGNLLRSDEGQNVCLAATFHSSMPLAMALNWTSERKR
jgi:hypothetical protein